MRDTIDLGDFCADFNVRTLYFMIESFSDVMQQTCTFGQIDVFA